MGVIIPIGLDGLCETCHNPIFTHGIFSDVDTQDEAARTEPAWSDEGPPRQITSKRGLGHISQNPTKFFEGWPRFDRSLTEPFPTRLESTMPRNPQNVVRDTFPRVWRALTKFDQVWPRFDRTVDLTKSWIELTTPWPLCKARWELRFDTLRAKNGRETRELWSKLWKNGPTLSQILLCVVDKTAYLRGNVCT
jgi:hypothetical protein